MVRGECEWAEAWDAKDTERLAALCRRPVVHDDAEGTWEGVRHKRAALVRAMTKEE